MTGGGRGQCFRVAVSELRAVHSGIDRQRVGRRNSGAFNDINHEQEW